MRAAWLLVSLATITTFAACGDDGGSGGGAGLGGSSGVGGSLGGSAGDAGPDSGGGAGQAGQAGAAGSAAGAGGIAGAGGSAGSAGAGGSAGSGAAPPVVTPGAADRILLKGTVITPSGVIDGEVLVEQTDITCVAASCASEAGASGATVIDTNGVIMPGMIDAHNHGLFNIFDEDDWTPKQLYSNHNQWASASNEPRYADEVLDAKQALESTAYGLACELDKYAETKAIIGATTSFLLGASQARVCYSSLARTIDTQFNDLPADKVQVSSLGVPTNSGAQSICNNFANGNTDAYVVHVAEGIDQTSLNEFATLAARGISGDPVAPPGCLLSSKTTIVHGTALTSTQFATMAQHDMGLVWSPKSNVFLYGETTDIPAAITAGVDKIALAPDWALGGSVNLLDELAFAQNWDDTKWGNQLTSKQLVEMATIGAARALAVDQYIGSIEVGKRADLVVVTPVATDAHDTIVQTRPNGVRLTMVDGRILYGDKAVQAAAPATPGCEDLTICGASKFICVAESSSSDKLDQTLAEITTALETGLTQWQTDNNPPGGPLMPLAPLAKCP